MVSTQGHGDRTALVVIDVQNAVVANAWDRDGVVGRIATLIGRVREEGAPVIFVQHDEPGSGDMDKGSEGWRFVDALGVREDDIVVAKQYPDSFVETTLAATLADLGAGRLVLAGAQTDACIRSTFHRALAEGYDVTLVSDCHTTDDRAFQGVTITGEQIVTHTNLYALFSTYPGQVSGTATHDEVAFASAPASV